MSKPATLYVIEGDYGLISLDVDCIQSILYTKLKNIPVEIKLQNSIRSCALYNSPCWKCGNITVEKFPNLVKHWKTIHEDVDDQLSAKEASETLALINLVKMKLNPVIQFLYWIEQRNSEELTSRWFMRALPFPFNYSYIKSKKIEALQLVEILYPLDTDVEVIKEYVAKTATQSLSTLSTRLGKSQFFYGDNPMTLDVVVYAHLAPFVKLPFPSNEIPSLLSMWPNLTEFVKRIDAQYFPDVKPLVKYLQSETSNKHDDEVSYVAIFILAVSATSLVVGFAVKRGFLKLPNLL